MMWINEYRRVVAVAMFGMLATAFPLCSGLQAGESADWAELEQQFIELPGEARRLTGPLFWLHGDESPERLRSYLEKVAEGGNGCFTAESRPHADWLGPGWYRDLKICLEAAKRLDLHMWIFDEKWWPSGEVGGTVPQKYGSKYMETLTQEISGPRGVRVKGPRGDKLIALLAGRVVDGKIDGESLIDLTRQVSDGVLQWEAPQGTWRLMTFSWRYSEGRRGRLLVDGASQEAVDWYIRTVYQPHYDHFADDFGDTIRGYFYDEPETYGDWGTAVIPELKRRGVDWKRALVAWKFELADLDEQVAAKYQYQDAFAEAWGKTFYGALTQWCHEHNVLSIGHWLEHRREYLDPMKCAGNMFQVQKYSDMGGIDAVFRQFVPGQKDDNTYQTPKLGSSISHAYGKKDDLAMVEIFGARGQDLTYAEMKWWTDHMHVSGINFHIPHAFNPRSPFDRDCPPYFYNSGYEPRWPLYRVYADYTSRLSLLLHGGRHVCPVALLYLGNSYHVGEATPPEDMTTALQDALFDCDWIPYDVFEGDMSIVEELLHLRDERYRVLIVPAAEVIPYATLSKTREFFESGGIVIGYGRLPSRSATLGKTSEDIASLRDAIWGQCDGPSMTPCRTSSAGGRAYFLTEKPTPEQIRQVLTGDAGLHPTLEVLEGETHDWLHVLHRVKEEHDIFLIANQQHEGPTKQFRLRAHAAGVPECWDPMRGQAFALDYRRAGEEAVEFSLTLEPLESTLVVFRANARELPSRSILETTIEGPAMEIEREAVDVQHPPLPERDQSLLEDCPWVWHADDPSAVPPCDRYFRGVISLPGQASVVTAKMRVTADNMFVLFVNGKKVLSGASGYEDWRRARDIDLKDHLRPGTNVLAIKATNLGDAPNPAGLIGAYRIVLDDGRTLTGCIDKSWKSSASLESGWSSRDFDDSNWQTVKEVARYGGGPWKAFESQAGMLTLPPIKEADPFVGQFHLPTAWLEEGQRVWLEVTDIPHEDAAAVAVNGRYAGGFIGRPFRLDVTEYLKTGGNRIEIVPFAPASARLLLKAGDR